MKGKEKVESSGWNLAKSGETGVLGVWKSQGDSYYLYM